MTKKFLYSSNSAWQFYLLKKIKLHQVVFLGEIKQYKVWGGGDWRHCTSPRSPVKAMHHHILLWSPEDAGMICSQTYGLEENLQIVLPHHCVLQEAQIWQR